MNRKEQIFSTLEKMGYSPEYDDDGDIMLLYQMKNIYFMSDDENDTFVSVLLPQFYELEEGQEAVVLAVCNKMVRNMKVAKVYIDHTFENVSATFEFYYTTERSLQKNIREALKVLAVIRSKFRFHLDDMSEN